MKIKKIPEMTVYTADCRDDVSNCLFPNAISIDNADSLCTAVSRDYMGAAMQDNYRKNVNFLHADCLILDCDNDFSNDSDDWVTPNDVCDEFPDVAFAVHYSRHHMTLKDGKEPRPKFHVLFPIRDTADPDYYVALRETLQRKWPKFCNGSMPCSHFFIGTDPPNVGIYEGELKIDEFLKKNDIEIRRTEKDSDHSKTKAIKEKTGSEKSNVDFDAGNSVCTANDKIPVGFRHKTVLGETVSILKRFGNTKEAQDKFRALADRCAEPLPTEELDDIWADALNFYSTKIATDKNYVPPDQYRKQDMLKPRDATDVGEAEVFVKMYGDRLRYSGSSGWIMFDGVKWVKGDIAAHGLVQQLTADQLNLARSKLRDAQIKEAEVGDPAKSLASAEVKSCADFMHFVLDRRKTSRISATLTEARPALQVDVSQLDADPFILNTPAGIVNLRDGSMREHDPLDYCTKCTAVSPGTEGADKWADFLRQVTSGDDDLARYIQEVAGMFLVGKVMREVLVILFGPGGNGKSTFINCQVLVMGDYAGGLSSDVLIVNNRSGKGAELATLRGKRLVVAAELPENTRLDTATVKKLCSTDQIRCEPKYRQPFDFMPSHSTVLCSNFLPRVGSSDSGTWSRLVVVPFQAKFRGEENEVLNYADYLFRHAGPAILRWMIDGAQAFLKQRGHIVPPACVLDASEAYQRDNDWLAMFIEECCDVAENLQTQSSSLFKAYTAFCTRNNFFCHSMADFRHAVEAAGYAYKHTNRGTVVLGLGLKQ